MNPFEEIKNIQDEITDAMFYVRADDLPKALELMEIARKRCVAFLSE